jgi:hypothetical protein
MERDVTTHPPPAYHVGMGGHLVGWVVARQPTI